MSRRSSNDTGGILLLMLIIIALPIMIFIWLIKLCVSASKKIAVEAQKHNEVKSTKTTKTIVVNNRAQNDERSVFDDLADQVRDINASANTFLLSHQCTKCGKNLYDCKCKGKIEIEEIDNWEERCESCGELLEDCECDNKRQSKQDISQDMDDLDFDEMNDVWDEMDEDDDLI